MKPLSEAGRKKFVMIVGFEAGVLGLRWFKIVDYVFSKKAGQKYYIFLNYANFYWKNAYFFAKIMYYFNFFVYFSCEE